LSPLPEISYHSDRFNINLKSKTIKRFPFNVSLQWFETPQLKQFREGVPQRSFCYIARRNDLIMADNEHPRVHIYNCSAKFRRVMVRDTPDYPWVIHNCQESRKVVIGGRKSFV